MAIAFDAASSNSADDTGNISFTHTPSGTPKGVLVFVQQEDTQTDEVTSVTYGGVSMTEISLSPLIFDGTLNDSVVSAFFLGSSVPTGAQSVAVTVSGSSGKRAACITVTADADTEINVVDSQQLNTSGSTDTIAIGGVSSFVALGGISQENVVSAVTPRTGWTERQEVDMGGVIAFAHTYDTVGTTDVGFGGPTSIPYPNILVVAIKEVAGGGATTLTQTATFSDGDTFHAATVSRGAVTLTPALYSDGDTFHATTVSQSGAPQTLTPTLYADADTFHTPTVGRGAVTLTPALVSDGDTFYTHAVVLEGGPQTLSPELVVDGDTFHVATVTPGAVSLTPSLYTDADTFHAAEVAAGFNLQPEAYADPDTFYPATVSGGAVTLTPALLVDGDTFYSATVANAGVQTLEPGLLTDADTFYVPTVTGGARTIGAARSAGRQLQTGARSNIQTNRR